MLLYTTTLTSKGQFTVPKPIRDRLAISTGTKFDIQPTPEGFIAVPQRKPRILKLGGFLKKYDDGTPTNTAIEVARQMAVAEIVEK